MAHIDCICPPKADGEPRHPGGDEVELRERLDFRAGRAARYIISSGRQEGRIDEDIAAQLSEWYLLAGIRRWTVTDVRGKAIEPNAANIRAYLLENPDQRAADDLADEADRLYAEAVIAPLQSRASASSPSTSTSEPTSVTSGPTPRKRSKPSSTTTSRTAGTVTILRSPDGDSSSLQSSA